MTWLDQLVTHVPGAVADVMAMGLAAASMIFIVCLFAWLAITINNEVDGAGDEQL